MSILKPAIVALAAGTLAPAALADQHASQGSFTLEIRVSARDTASAENAMKFLNRLEDRVRRECGGRDLRRSLASPVWQRRAEIQTCVDTTMRSAVNSLQSPAIAEAYDLRRG